MTLSNRSRWYTEMISMSVILCFVLFSGRLQAASARIEKEYDVVIYGGTCAAVSSAVQVKQMGKSVVIVSPDIHLGGLSSGGLGATDSGNRTVIGGLSRDFYHRLWKYYRQEKAWKFQEMPRAIPGQGGHGIDNATETMWVFEPHVAEIIFENYVKEFQIPVFKNEWLDREKGVKKEGTTIKSITMNSGKTFSGKMFLDTTYEGDLMAASGISYAVGRENNAKYGETLNGIQVGNAKYHQFTGLVDPYIEKGNPTSGLLPWVNPKINGEDGMDDKKVQAYCLRMCLTNVPENRILFEKPENYKESDYELLFRSIEAGQQFFTTFSPMPNSKTDSNNNCAVSTDFIGANYEYPDGSYEKRREIYQAHLQWQRGLLWTLQNHPRVPEHIRNQFKDWGLSKDEFLDNGHWPHQLYIREARRMVSDFVVSERHLRYLDPTPRPIGMGSYNMDSHNIQRYVALDKNGKPTVRNEGDVEINPGGPYPIDYGAIIPKKSECTNLFIPVCVSCTHIAFGSIRMEPVFMLLGQSAATAAVLSLDNKVAPQDLDYALLSKKLIEDKQVLEFKGAVSQIPAAKLPGIVLDNHQAKLKGEWISGFVVPNFVGNDYIHDDGKGRGEKSATFNFKVPKEGKYECRLSYSINPNRATNVPVIIETDKSRLNVTVNQKEKPPINDLFVSLGVVEVGPELKGTIIVSNKDVNGYVILDAVQILPVK